MVHLPDLITDLALILGCAGAVTLLFKWIKQPVVLGYILVGLLVGPNLEHFPSIADTDSIKSWADIGVIFLLFALGLEFSFKKLLKIGGAATITGITELSLMMILGYSLGQYLNMSQMDSIFLGGIISISSTTIIFRAFEELDLKSRKFTGLVIGVLVIEDLVAIVLMVLLSTFAVTRSIAGTELFTSVFKLGLFLLVWFLMGIFLLPTFLRKTVKFLNAETLLIVSTALCFAMVVLAYQIGFSPALGAFAMGSLMSETTIAHRVEDLIKPIKDLFGAIFFVSVGMLIDPQVLIQYAWPVVLVTLAVIFGKTIFVSLGALLSGRTLRHAIQASTSMTQIGEFSFIIATLGLSLNVISDHLYPIAVGVSVITTFFTPFMMRLSDPMYQFINSKLPSSWISFLDRYSGTSQVIDAESKWKKLLRFYFLIILLNASIIVSIILMFDYFVFPYVMSSIRPEWVSKLITVLVGLIFMSPFLWALMAKKYGKTSTASLWLNRNYSKGPLVMLEVLRNVIAIVLIFIFVKSLFDWRIALLGIIVVSLIVVVVFKNKIQRFYSRLEDHFFKNLHEKETLMNEKTRSNLSPWDAHIFYYTINPHADFIGKSLEELQWREQYGVNVAYIERGNQVNFAPQRDMKLYPFDSIGVIGTDEQLKKFGEIMIPYEKNLLEEQVSADLQKIVVDELSPLKDLTIRESGIREKTDGLVVGIERKGHRILNPTSQTRLQYGDIIWIVGNSEKIQVVLER